jgi:2-dehydro-3-deoxyphosphooctonate aldolase (KDO 8-P synthase)
MAAELSRITRSLKLPFIFKASYDKANRTSIQSFRGPGVDEGARILRRIGDEVDVPVLTDVHEPADVPRIAGAVDVMQIPAFLCRQTDLIVAAARTGAAVNIKKGQFVSPWDMRHAVDKCLAVGNKRVFLTERGSSFGYNTLVSDMRAIVWMQDLGCPVIFDATHSVQMPGAGGDRSGGDRRMVPYLARAAVACGCDGVFLETHPRPDAALSDGPNMVPLDELPALIDCCLRLRAALAL